MLMILVAFAFAVALDAEQPETVMITLHAKPGAEQTLAAVIARHYDTARRLNLVVSDAPHVTLRSVEGTGKPEFVEIFTWRDREIPDHAPKEILAIWQDMNNLVEPRMGQPGLTITEMVPVKTAK
jgi:hypothetical protein